MTIVKVVCYVFASITALLWLLTSIGIFMGGFSGLARLFSRTPNRDEQFAAGASVIAMGVMQLGNLLFFGVWFVFFLFVAESIRIMLDVQRDTHETAFYTKQNSTP